MSKVAGITKAMLLAAGRGERMRPLTDSIPKPLVEVAGKPLIDWQLDMLMREGVNDVVINSSYLAENLENYVAKRQNPLVTISHEVERLETGGGILKALPLLGRNAFFCLNSDVIIQDADVPALSQLMAEWDDATMDILMLLHPTQTAIGYDGVGDFFIDSGRLCRRMDRESAPYVFTGVQIIHPRVFEQKKMPDRAFSLNEIYNREINDEGWLDNRISYAIHQGQWLHVGSLAEKQLAEKFLEKL